MASKSIDENRSPWRSRSWREEFGWMIHNLVGHPVGELLYWLMLRSKMGERMSNWLHDVTIPDHVHGTGRG